MSDQYAIKLAESVKALINAGVVDEVIEAVDKEELTRSATVVTISRIASGRSHVNQIITRLLEVWVHAFSTISSKQFAQIISSLANAIELEKQESIKTEVVWTGPDVEGTYLRKTRQVVQDIISNSKRELLVVGYWIAGNDEGEGIIRDVIELIANAVKRNVKVTMVLDEREKPYGDNNRDTLISMWPSNTPLPNLLTWKIPSDENHLKLHAKVLISDRTDSLVTSANLTMYAMDRNIEMGVRVSGNASEKIALHFDLLMKNEILVSFDD